MKTAYNMVKEFHKKYGFLTDAPIYVKPELKEMYAVIGKMLLGLSSSLEQQAVELQANENDPTLYRIHLMLEELGELIEAFASGDVVAVFDGLCDLNYVTVGFGVTYNLPLAEGFAEVHRSNMTKALRNESGERMRAKGENYSPPDLNSILEQP